MQLQTKYIPVTEDNISIGNMVIPGANWCYGNQDDSLYGKVIGIGPCNVFIKEPTPKGWCAIEWNKNAYNYRIGAEGGMYDLYHLAGSCKFKELEHGILIKIKNNGKQKAIKVQRIIRTVRRSYRAGGTIIRCRTSRAKCKGVNI